MFRSSLILAGHLSTIKNVSNLKLVQKFFLLFLVILATIIANPIVVGDVKCKLVLVEQQASSALARRDGVDVFVQVDHSGF